MSRPTKVKVGHVLFTIKWVDKDDWKDPETDGTMEMSSGTIEINVGPEESMEIHRQECLMHEILHAVFATTQITHEKWHRLDDVEEHVVRYTSPTLMNVLRDNPKVLEYLLR
jgi:hypothetical protein